MKYLLTGDWQASARNLPQIQKAVERETLAMLAHDCDELIDLGDLKEPYDPIPVRVALAMQERLRDKKYIVVRGNHDRLSQNDDELTWFDLLDTENGHRFITERDIVRKDGVVFYVLPYSGMVDTLRKDADWLADMARDNRAGSQKSPKDGRWGYINQQGDEHVLLFHCEVREAQGAFSTDALSIADLQLDAYTYAFGGHIHRPQELVEGKAWYVGSPFCMDWGEVNQEKRFMVYEPGKPPKSIPVGLPGLYDWDYARKLPPGALDGSTVRLRVPAKDGTHYKALAKKRASQFALKYPNAVLHCVPEYEKTEVTDYSFTQGDDAQKVKSYVEQKHDADPELTAYVVKTLEQAASTRTLNTEGIRFLTARAKNYTSFQTLKIDYRKQGIVLVNGRNEDWPGRSIGSGKSNWQDLLKVAMFGETGKGQTADAWASDTFDDKAWVQLVFDNAQGQKIEIVRTRRPAGVSVKVDNEDWSSGLSGRERTGTQGLITQLSGYDLRMLTNAVYIDQERAHKFLTGTRKEKSELLYKFQGLERFETARTLVAADVKTVKGELDRAITLELVSRTKLEALQPENDRLKALQTDLRAQLNAATRRQTKIHDTMPAFDGSFTTELAELRTKAATVLESKTVAHTKAAVMQQQIAEHTANWKIYYAATVKAQHTLDSLPDEFTMVQASNLAQQITSQTQVLGTLAHIQSVAQSALESLEQELVSLGTGVCPACMRPFDDAKILARRVKILERSIEEARTHLVASEKNCTKAKKSLADLRTEHDVRTQQSMDRLRAQQSLDLASGRIDSLPAIEDLKSSVEQAIADEAKFTQVHSKLQTRIDEIESLRQVFSAWQAEKTAEEAQIAGLEAQLQKAGIEAANLKSRYTSLSVEATTHGQVLRQAQKQLSLYTRAVACLDRTGIPAYLCGMLCPSLSKAAEEYAKLFSDDTLQIVFEFIDGEFDCKVINGQGSSEVEGLSTGEKATAALITAFALRSAAPKTNVLVLDEPGRGLDALGLRHFAIALSSLKSEFETIIISTHDQTLASGLTADAVLTVVKTNRVSRVESNT
jgi:DNA repair exonuclease SbcCD ATPase subunit/DNA repair exonuclease SbcCD nuclease subunit